MGEVFGKNTVTYGDLIFEYLMLWEVQNFLNEVKNLLTLITAFTYKKKPKTIGIIKVYEASLSTMKMVGRDAVRDERKINIRKSPGMDNKRWEISFTV